MERRPPASPMEAWEEDDSSSQDSSSVNLQLLSFYDMTTMQPLQLDASWLPIYEVSEDAVDFIMAFVSSLNKETHKATFLKSIYILCKTALKHGLTQGLDLFCQTCEVAENIQEILENEPKDRLTSRVRHLAMLAIEELSLVENVLEGKTKNLLSACFSSVFWLPPEKEMPYRSASLYVKTLKSMDTMLRTVVLSFPASRVSQELQDILEMLLDFTRSRKVVVQERAVGRIGLLTSLLPKYSSLKASVKLKRDSSGPVCPGDIPIPIIGKLLGRLIVLRYSRNETSSAAFHALFSLADFMFKSRPKDRSNQPVWEAMTTSSLCFMSTKDCTQAFGKYLQSSETADVIFEAIKGMTDASILDKQVSSGMLDAAMEDPNFWLTDVPKIVNSILENLPCINTDTDLRKVKSLFLLMINKRCLAVLISLCEMALQKNSTVQELWAILSSMPEVFNKILQEFATLLWKQWCNPPRKCTDPPHRAPSFEQIDMEELGNKPNIWNDQGYSDVVMGSLLLEVLVGLSERHEMAGNIDVFLPSLMKILEAGDEDERLKIVMVCQNVLGQLRNTKASSIAVPLVGKILPLFDSECSQLRELSLWLCRDLLRSVVSKDEKAMRRQIQSALVPLLFRVSDQDPGVAKASGEALFAAAELLNWQTLKHLLQKERMWELGECLLMRRSSMAEEYMQQSLPYLSDPQSSVRLAAVRFIGCATKHMTEQDLETHAYILNALQPLEKDRDISISSLAARTGLILRSQRAQQKSSVVFQMLCCWCR